MLPYPTKFFCLGLVRQIILPAKNKVVNRSNILKISSPVFAQNSICGIHTCQTLLKRRKTAEERKMPNAVEVTPKSKGQLIDIWQNITMGELAEILDKDINFVHQLFIGKISDKDTPIHDIKEIHNAIRRSGNRMRIIAKPTEGQQYVEKKDIFRRPPPVKLNLKPRPPIVTVMGHVDHGKTTLLDALRHSHVVDQEFGGITQHIGAFCVKLASGAEVTFLDTPGHAAFSAMRARGANLTDIVVLVVAADDGVMEQTVECINMAKQARVPILVAINKIDAKYADIGQTEQMLLQKGIQIETLGGDIQAIHISALKRINLDKLTEALALQAELLEIGADPTGPVEAVVVDSRIDPHRGRLCTVVVQRGTLRRGSILIANTAMAKVREIKDSHCTSLNSVKPGYPAEIEGWRELPSAGELVLEVESEKRAKSIIKFRESMKSLERQQIDQVAILNKREQHQKVYQDKLLLRRKLGRFKLRGQGPRKPESLPKDSTPTLHMIIKSDVDGTLEAIIETLSTYDCPECRIDLIHYGVGPVTDNDVELAKTFKGIIYAFNVSCPISVQEKVDVESVTVKHHNVIYKLIDTIKEDINKIIPPKQVEEILGEAHVLQQFLINEGRKSVPIAGCRCDNGVLKRTARYRVTRNNVVIYEGSLASMRHLKNEVDVIKTDTECGLQFDNKSINFIPGDTIVCYEHKLEPQLVQWDPGF